MDALSGIPENLQEGAAILWEQIAEPEAPPTMGICSNFMLGCPGVAKARLSAFSAVGMVRCAWSGDVNNAQGLLREPEDLKRLGIRSSSELWVWGRCGAKPVDGETQWHLPPPEIRMRHRSASPNMAVAACESKGSPAVMVVWPILDVSEGEELCFDWLAKPTRAAELKLDMRAMLMMPYMNAAECWADPDERNELYTRLQVILNGQNSPVAAKAVAQESAANHKQVVG